MIQVGRVPVATVREVPRHADDDSTGRTIRLGAALWALPQVLEPDADDEFVRAAHGETDQLPESLGWSNARALVTIYSPTAHLWCGRRAPAAGLHMGPELLVSYGRLMHQVAALDLGTPKALHRSGGPSPCVPPTGFEPALPP